MDGLDPPDDAIDATFDLLTEMEPDPLDILLEDPNASARETLDMAMDELVECGKVLLHDGIASLA